MALLNIKLNKKLLPLSIALAMSAFTTNSYAEELNITASVSYNVGTGANNVNGTNTQVLDTTTSTNNNVFTSAYESSINYDSTASTSAYGTTDGAFYARARGEGVSYNTASSITYVDTIFNNTSIAQDYTIDFTVIQGALEVYGTPTTATDFGQAGYTIDVFLTNSSGVTSSIFSSTALLSMDSNGDISFTGTGTSLNPTYNTAAPSGNYSWTDYSPIAPLNLGSFAANDSFTLTYGMTASASGQFTPASAPPGSTTPINTVGFFDGCEECGGEGDGGFFTGGGSSSRTGDPFAISAPTISSTPTQVASVPEASSLLLMSLGLVGLGAMRRRKSN